jgi:hypothetical protein
LVGNNGNKGNNKKNNMKNNMINKIEWKVELLFVEPVTEMKGDSTTSFSSSSSTNNHPPINITLNSLNKYVAIIEMLDLVLKVQEKINNNNDGSPTNTTQLNRSHGSKEFKKLKSLDDGEEDTDFTVIWKSR